MLEPDSGPKTPKPHKPEFKLEVRNIRLIKRVDNNNCEELLKRKRKKKIPTSSGSSFSGLICLNIEVSEFVLVLAGGDDSQVLLQVLLLEVLLGEILEVALAQGNGGLHNDVLRILAHSHCGAQVASFALHLYPLLQEVLEVVQHYHVVFNRQFAVYLVLQ